MTPKIVTILVVDDDAFLRDLYASRFVQDGFEVRTAPDGEAALEAITRAVPDAIFTGIKMPRLDGFMLMRTLQENPRTKNIPVFISSHQGRPADAKEAEALGAKGFFIRYLTTPQEVALKIRNFFEGRQSYLVAVDPRRYDAPKLFADKSGRPVREALLELTPDPKRPDSFIARLKQLGK